VEELPTVTALEIDNLHKSYGSLKALDGVSFTVDGGEIFGFVGGNGAGKTTTMRIVLGVLAANAGQVRWGGHLVDLDDRRRIGYMPSERGLYPTMTVRDQLVYLARLHGKSTAIARKSAETWAERLGLGHRLDDKLQALSLGNQQRVQLAAAMVHDPDLLVLDEPFSGLDPMAVDVMSGVLSDAAARGVPVVFSSHQLELVERLCHRVGIIENGRMVAVGTVAELSATAHPRFVVAGPAPEAWLPALSDARLVSQDGNRAIIEVTTSDGQAVLAAAQAVGPVTEFGPSRETLTDLYRDVVATKEPVE